MKKISLNSGWKLCDTGFSVKHPAEAAKYAQNWYLCQVPCDVRMPLMEHGVIRDPVLADYAHDSEWIEQRAWWYFKTFSCSREDLDAEAVELVAEAIDTRCDVFLNGILIGSQANVHRAFQKDVKEYLTEGENCLAIRVTTGLEEVTEEDVGDLHYAVCHETLHNRCGDTHRGDMRRAFVRRPQYTIGWDWGPRVVTCGIVGEVSLNIYQKIAIRELRVSTAEIRPDGSALLSVMANIENLSLFATRDCDARLTVEYQGQLCGQLEWKQELLTGGYNYLEGTLEIPDAKLWWPNGYGEQPLYEVRMTAVCEGKETSYPVQRVGIRTVRMDLSPTGKGRERIFALRVNGVRIFCKGGDWIPADSIYARVSREKYTRLVEEAVCANFNTFRIWGGGLYEKEFFYQLCDQKGILLWQDFMFACSTYPDHREAFSEECRRELDYQTKRLRNHPSIALFCGNNEDQETFPQDEPQRRWGLHYTRNRQPGLAVSNLIAKTVMHQNCPDIPYWNSSPYGGEKPTSEEIGDVHHWGAAMMNPDMKKRIDPFVYDQLGAKFVSEYGYIGPCSLETIRDYFDGRPIDRDSEIWKLHNNNFEKDTVLAGIRKHYPLDTAVLSLEDYILYAGAVHELILGYSLEAIRFKEQCHGALFWMYNDTWGEVGWTIVDYYLRRKTGFYGVKRAFAPLKLSMRAVDGKLLVQACNDTPEEVSVRAQLGYLSFDGKEARLEPLEIQVPARSRRYVYEGPLPDYDAKAGCLAVIPEGAFEPCILRAGDLKDWRLPSDPQLQAEVRQEGENAAVTVSSPVYAHLVRVEGDFRCSDNYFDLLPGQSKTITVYGAEASGISVRAYRPQ